MSDEETIEVASGSLWTWTCSGCGAHGFHPDVERASAEATEHERVCTAK